MTFIAMLLGGFFGSGHCVGMCGGFALSIGALRPRLAQALPLQLVYTAGRIITYAFIGALAGAAGAALGRSLPLAAAQRVVALVSGAAMLAVGLSALGVLRSTRAGAWLGALFAPLFRHHLNARSLRGALLAGVFTGFLPCGLVYAFAALAMTSGEALRGLIGMACFGLGTAPAMIALGCGAAWLGASVRSHAHRLAACFVILLGVATLWRALPGAPCPHADAPAGSALPDCHPR